MSGRRRRHGPIRFPTGPVATLSHICGISSHLYIDLRAAGTRTTIPPATHRPQEAS
jgi:hypothetical protein